MSAEQAKPRSRWRRLIQLGSALLAALGALFACAYPEIGRAPSGKHADRISKSPNYDKASQRFVNRRQTYYDESMKKMTMSAFFKASMFGKQVRSPEQKLPQAKVDLEAFLKSDGMAYVWLGHSTILVRLDGKTILLDPVFHNAAPVPFVVRRFQDPVLRLEDLPPIDLILISHDHYDHLSRRSIQHFRNTKTQFAVPLGVSSYLVGWGIERARIVELDWWQEHNFDGVKVACTPSQHFSGRAGMTANPTLWASWAVLGKTERFYFSGDSGYDEHFTAIGDRYGPFDVAFMECGQYNPLWSVVHLFPNETVRAGKDLGAKRVQPIHWGMFELSHHDWFEPPEFARRFGDEIGVKVYTPVIGQLVRLKGSEPTERWWKDAIKPAQP